MTERDTSSNQEEEEHEFWDGPFLLVGKGVAYGERGLGRRTARHKGPFVGLTA